MPSIEEYEHLIWSLSVVLRPGVGVDVVHQIHLLLGEIRKGGTFWKDPSDHRIVVLAVPLLPRGQRMTIEHACEDLTIFVLLYLLRFCELRPIVCKDYREEPLHFIGGEPGSQMPPDMCRSGTAVAFPKERQLQGAIQEQESKKTSPFSPWPFDGIHLYDLGCRIFFHVRIEVLLPSAFPVLYQ